MRSRHIADVIHAVAGFDLRKNGAVVRSIEDFCERSTSDEQVARCRIHCQTARTFLSTCWIPIRDGLLSLYINGESTVLVFQVGIETAAAGVNDISLRHSLESELCLLFKRLAIKHADGLIARNSYPNFLSRRYIHNSIGHGIDVAAGATSQGASVDSTDGEVPPVADVDDTFTKAE